MACGAGMTDPVPQCTGLTIVRQGASAVADELTADPRSFLLGLGPANSTTHAAEVLARGAKNGVSLPAPGPWRPGC